LEPLLPAEREPLFPAEPLDPLLLLLPWLFAMSALL
jgi:hypothetical protein